MENVDEWIDNEEIPFSDQENSIENETDPVAEIPMQTELLPLAAHNEPITVQQNPSPLLLSPRPKIVVKKPLVAKTIPPSKQTNNYNWLLYVALTMVLCAYAYPPIAFYLKPVYWKTHFQPSYNNTVYELWTQQHNTTSYKIDYTLKEAKQLAKLLQPVFQTHFVQNPELQCLCMHHLHMDRIQKKRAKLYQLCAVYNHPMQQMYLMANPILTGHGNHTNVYEQRSVSCQENDFQRIHRFTDIFIDWIDPISIQPMYYRFQNTQAACMQLAIQEFQGNQHCHS